MPSAPSSPATTPNGCSRRTATAVRSTPAPHGSNRPSAAPRRATYCPENRVRYNESIRQWCLKFGADFARKLRQRRPQPGDTWHLDEEFLKINGELHYLWRAVDQHGVVLDILVQDRRNAAAAKRFFKRLLAGLKYKPKRLVTDGLRSYGVAQREVLPEVRHRTSRYLNNRAENSHRPTRRRER